jgi:hypothetical protein
VWGDAESADDNGSPTLYFVLIEGAWAAGKKGVYGLAFLDATQKEKLESGSDKEMSRTHRAAAAAMTASVAPSAALHENRFDAPRISRQTHK